MTEKKRWIAMILAGGQGSRLGVLTKNMAKPALYFGGKWRIIDFTLSNCVNSGIDTVGVLTQYKPLELNDYIANGSAWDLDRMYGGVHILPPYQQDDGGKFYKGTANAIFQNLNFIERYEPEYVVVLSGDHIYRMNYEKMLKYHIDNNADCTIAVLNVSYEEASRFGIMNADSEGRIFEFEEKPKRPNSTLASMGVYIFSTDKLKKYLIADEKDEKSQNDFGKNIIPKMLSSGERIFAYNFKGYWKDVGTVKSLWEANMDLLSGEGTLQFSSSNLKVYSKTPPLFPQYISQSADVKNAIISEGCEIFGKVTSSVLFCSVRVEDNARISDSVIMPNCKIGKNTKIYSAILGKGCQIGDNCIIGEKGGELCTLASKIKIGDNVKIEAGETLKSGRKEEKRNAGK